MGALERESEAQMAEKGARALSEEPDKGVSPM